MDTLYGATLELPIKGVSRRQKGLSLKRLNWEQRTSLTGRHGEPELEWDIKQRVSSAGFDQ